MTFPSAWTVIPVTGTYINRFGIPCVGWVSFSSPQIVLGNGTVLTPQTITFQLDSTGSFSGSLPATDDPLFSPANWAYTVLEKVPDGRQPFDIQVPHTSSGINMSTVVPVAPPPTLYPYVSLQELASTAPGKGAKLVGYNNGGTATDVSVMLDSRPWISVLEPRFGVVGNNVADDTAALTAALNYAGANGYGLDFTGAKCKITSAIALAIGYNPSLRANSSQYGIFASGVTLNGNSLIGYSSASNFVIDGVTIDFANGLVTVGSEGSLGLQNCDNFHIRNSLFPHVVGSGLALNGVRQFSVIGNTITKDLASGSYNQAINVSSSARQSQDGYIAFNECQNTAIDVSCTRCTIAYNHISNWKFGFGVTTEQDSANSNYYIITGNIIHGGSGTDVNLTNPGGIENWGAYSLIAGNLCYANSGDGVSQGGARSQVIGNTCFNNGVTGGSGIVSRYGTSVYNGSNSTISGNQCFDTNGALGTQLYGYSEQSASLFGIVLGPNSFNRNKTGMSSILSSTTAVRMPTLYGKSAYVGATITTGSSAQYNFTLGGAALGDVVRVSYDQSLGGLIVTAYVDVANDVRIVMYNPTGSSIVLAAGNWRVWVEKTPETVSY